MVLQELIFPYIGDTELYFRIDNGKIENKEILLNKNGTLKTNTFFNIFSSGKWFKRGYWMSGFGNEYIYQSSGKDLGVCGTRQQFPKTGNEVCFS